MSKELTDMIFGIAIAGLAAVNVYQSNQIQELEKQIANHDKMIVGIVNIQRDTTELLKEYLK